MAHIMNETTRLQDARRASGLQGRSPSEDVSGLWAAACELRSAVAGVLEKAPDSVRLGAVKFTEQAVLLASADAKPPPPPGAASLAGSFSCSFCVCCPGVPTLASLVLLGRCRGMENSPGTRDARTPEASSPPGT